MSILITGANGYLGGYLLQAFGPLKALGLRRARPGVMALPAMVEFDNHAEIEAILSAHKISTVINVVGCYGRASEPLSELYNANLVFGQTLLEATSRSEAKLFINIGTSLPSCVSPYARTKNMFSAELIQQRFEGLRTVNLALEQFYGPNEHKQRFVGMVIDACQSNQPLALTVGTQQRDFIHVDDIVGAIETIIDKQAQLEDHESIALGSGKAVTVKAFVQQARLAFESSAVDDFGAVPMRTNELMHSEADTHRLRSLGWAAQYTIANGLEQLATMQVKQIQSA